MANLTLTILPAKVLKGGKHKVRIAVAHNSATRYIITDVVIDSIKEWKNGQVVKRGDAAYLNTKLRKSLNDVQRAIDELPYIEGLTCSELIDAVTNKKREKSYSLESAFEEMISVSNAKESTKNTYRIIFKSICRHLPASTLVRSLTPVMLKKYIKERNDLKPIHIKHHMSVISMIINHCQQNGYTDFKVSPTSHLVESVVSVRQNWLSPEQVRHLRDSEVETIDFVKYRDIFMLSYYLGGINLIDLLKINFNKNRSHLIYKRSKTERLAKVNEFVEFDIPEEAATIIDTYKRKDGYINCNYSTYDQERAFYTRMSKRVSSLLGIPDLTFYSARKSFAQHAFSLGINESVIDFILGHSLGSGKNTMLYSYIKVTPDMATEAIRKVCDFIASSRNF